MSAKFYCLNNHSFINVGIVAHVDAGKTSLTEKLLFHSGEIEEIGSVDKGTSITDWLTIEKERGISIRTATASLLWKNVRINIIDTPGHVDFSSEVNRSFAAMDVVVLVISAVEGIQGHTSNLWSAIRKSGKPCIIFINKTDRSGSDSAGLIKKLGSEFKTNFITLNSISGEESELLSEVQGFSDEVISKSDSTIAEQIINLDDNLIEKYINENDFHQDEILDSLKRQISELQSLPVIIGSAKIRVGINSLLECLTSLIIPSDNNPDSAPSGIIYKVDHNDRLGKIASIRLFSGTLKNRDVVKIGGVEEKITQIKKLQGQKFTDTGILVAGDTAAVCGLTSVVAGDIIGEEQSEIPEIKLNTPVLIVKVYTSDDKLPELVDALQKLSAEDPELDLVWLKDQKEINIKIMGVIQLQVLSSVIKERFNLDVEFGSPSVIYKETPEKEFTVVEEYTMPKPCWAVVRFKVEPLDRGMGVEFVSQASVNDIAIRYQQEVERNISSALKQGNHGWEVTGLRITLIGDEDHNVHSRAGDFGVATHMALMKGFDKNGTTLLEPIHSYKIQAPEEYLGKIIGTLTQLRGIFDNPQIENGSCFISGRIPVATSIDFPTKLASLTQGKAIYSTVFYGYEECNVELGETVPYRGVNPLDRAKYILKARKALG